MIIRITKSKLFILASVQQEMHKMSFLFLES